MQRMDIKAILDFAILNSCFLTVQVLFFPIPVVESHESTASSKVYKMNACCIEY